MSKKRPAQGAYSGMWTRPKAAPPAQGPAPSPRGEPTDWRLEQLVRAGFDPRLAALVAADRAMEVDALIELVNRGCPPRLAARILAPLERKSY
jgi:hypothetical protein